MRSIKLSILVIAIVALAGCASNHGTQAVNDFNRFLELEAGTTTKANVFESFGQPHTVNYIEQTGESIWGYYSVQERMNATTFIPYVGMVTGGSDLNITSAAFYFDPEGIYIRSDRNERSRYQNMWTAMGDSFTRTGQVDIVRDEMAELGLPFDEQIALQGASIADVWANE